MRIRSCDVGHQNFHRTLFFNIIEVFSDAVRSVAVAPNHDWPIAHRKVVYFNFFLSTEINAISECQMRRCLRKNAMTPSCYRYFYTRHRTCSSQPMIRSQDCTTPDVTEKQNLIKTPQTETVRRRHPIIWALIKGSINELHQC